MQSANPSSDAQPGKRRVTVLAEPAEAVTQPDDFHLCPLGLQFYSVTPVELFTLLQVDIEAPDDQGMRRPVSCSGAVVHCRPDQQSGRHRVWIQFLDLPNDVRERIRCTARNGHLLCAYCENF